MAFGAFDGSRSAARPMAEINMVPLIDVMLVLVVIFMLTAPLLTHAVRVDLPRASSAPESALRDRVDLTIDAAGALHWNGAPVDRAILRQQLAAAAARQPQPALHLRVDRAARYEAVAEAVADAAAAGIGRIGFVSDPAPAR